MSQHSYADDASVSAQREMRAMSHEMSDIPDQMQQTTGKKQVDYERARSKSRDRKTRDPAMWRSQEEEEEDEARYRPYREDNTMDAAHERIQQRKDAEQKLHARLMGHLGQLPKYKILKIQLSSMLL